MLPSLDGRAPKAGPWSMRLPDQEVSALEVLASDEGLADPEAVLAFFGKDVQALRRMTPQQIREVIGHTASYHLKRGWGPAR